MLEAASAVLPLLIASYAVVQRPMDCLDYIQPLTSWRVPAHQPQLRIRLHLGQDITFDIPHLKLINVENGIYELPLIGGPDDDSVVAVRGQATAFDMTFALKHVVHLAVLNAADFYASEESPLSGAYVTDVNGELIQTGLPLPFVREYQVHMGCYHGPDTTCVRTFDVENAASPVSLNAAAIKLIRDAIDPIALHLSSLPDWRDIFGDALDGGCVPAAHSAMPAERPAPPVAVMGSLPPQRRMPQCGPRAAVAFGHGPYR